MNASTGPAPDAPRWRRRLRLLYRAYRYRWKKRSRGDRFCARQVRPGTIAIDVGAHKGGYTYWLARGVGPTGRVYAFEPQPQLARNLQRSFDPARVTVENAGVSDHEGAMQLHIPTDGRPSPGASLEATSTATATGHAIEVRVLTLDRYLRDLSGPRAGGGFPEMRRLRVTSCTFSAAPSRCLCRDLPVLLFECEQRHHGTQPITEVFTYLESLGYTGRFFHEGRLARWRSSMSPSTSACQATRILQ